MCKFGLCFSLHLWGVKCEISSEREICRQALRSWVEDKIGNFVSLGRLAVNLPDQIETLLTFLFRGPKTVLIDILNCRLNTTFWKISCFVFIIIINYILLYDGAEGSLYVRT